MLSILAPALLAGFIVLLSHVPLGREVLKRGIIFIDLAIAQMAGLGLIIAGTMGFEAHGIALQLVALVSALLGAFFLAWLESKVGQYQEAMIGICFVLAATAALILLAKNVHGGEHLKDLLVGQILWVEWQQLIMPGIINLVIFALWFIQPQLFQGKSFYLLFAIAITTSVQLVGVYLVFASLIIPAIAVTKLADKKAIGIALATGTIAYAIGLGVSTWLDLPSGAVIVWALAVCSLASFTINTRCFNKP